MKLLPQYASNGQDKMDCKITPSGKGQYGFTLDLHPDTEEERELLQQLYRYGVPLVEVTMCVNGKKEA